jgi:hypothetical protein
MKRFVFHLAVAILMATPVLAQQQQGDTELQLQGSLSISTKSGDNNSGSATVNWGRFFTNQQEFGGTVTTFFNGNGDLSGFAGPFWRLNLGQSKTVPYIGASVATTFGEFSSGDAIANIEGGVRWFLSRSAAFTLGGLYTYDVKQKDFNDSVQVLFGFSYLWGK